MRATWARHARSRLSGQQGQTGLLAVGAQLDAQKSNRISSNRSLISPPWIKPRRRQPPFTSTSLVLHSLNRRPRRRLDQIHLTPPYETSRRRPSSRHRPSRLRPSSRHRPSRHRLSRLRLSSHRPSRLRPPSRHRPPPPSLSLNPSLPLKRRIPHQRPPPHILQRKRARRPRRRKGPSAQRTATRAGSPKNPSRGRAHGGAGGRRMMSRTTGLTASAAALMTTAG